VVASSLLHWPCALFIPLQGKRAEPGTTKKAGCLYCSSRRSGQEKTAGFAAFVCSFQPFSPPAFGGSLSRAGFHFPRASGAGTRPGARSRWSPSLRSAG